MCPVKMWRVSDAEKDLSLEAIYLSFITPPIKKDVFMKARQHNCRDNLC
jgi:hypothetical protein